MSLIGRIRRALPTPSGLKQTPGLGWLGSYLARRPWLLAVSRRRVARGIGVGLAVGVIPLPTQMLMAALCAVPFRANVGAAVAATWLTNPLTAGPIWALSGWFGSFLVEAPIAEAWEMTQAAASLDEILPWREVTQQWIVAVGKPVLVGLPITGALLGVSAWLLVSAAWSLEVRRRRGLRLRARSAAALQQPQS